MHQEFLRFDQGKSIAERFEEWIAQHPDIPALFERFAREAKSTGRKRFGAKAIAERIRWFYATSTSGDIPKWDNNFTSRMARLLAERHPEDFADFFEFRQLRS